MRITQLEKFLRGWIVGDFSPTLLRTKQFEFAVKNYRTGEKEEPHFHKVATEISVVVHGLFSINGKKLKAGDVLIMKPFDISDFKCIKSGSTAIIKIPSVKGDKYLVKKEK